MQKLFILFMCMYSLFSFHFDFFTQSEIFYKRLLLPHYASYGTENTKNTASSSSQCIPGRAAGCRPTNKAMNTMAKHGINRGGRHKMATGPRDWRKELKNIQQGDPATSSKNYGTHARDACTHTRTQIEIKTKYIRDGPETGNLHEMASRNGGDTRRDVCGATKKFQLISWLQAPPFVSNPIATNQIGHSWRAQERQQLLIL